MALRVLLINVGYRGGGAERYTRELLPLLADQGIEAELWIGRHEQNLPANVRVMPHPWERLLDPLEAVPHWSDWRHRGSRRMLDGVVPGSFDLIHLNVLHSGCCSIRAVQRLCRRLPSVWTMHDEWAMSRGLTSDLRGRISPAELQKLSGGWRSRIPYHAYHDNPRYSGLSRFLTRWLPRPKVAIGGSQWTVDRIEEAPAFTGVTTELIRLPVLLGRDRELPLQPAAREALGLPSHRPVVLMLGANVAAAVKGIRLGLEAVQQLADDVVVVVAGRGGESLKSIAPPETRFLFAKDAEELVRLYRAADVTLVPSLSETGPFVALESLICGTAVVGFRAGGLTEIAEQGKGALLAIPYDPESLVHRLKEILADPGMRTAMAEEGQAWVRSECDPQRHVQNLIAAYESAIQQFDDPD